MEQSLGELKTTEANFIKANDNYKRIFVKSDISGVITNLDIKNITREKETKVYILDLDKTVIEKVREINLYADTNAKKYNIKIQIPNNDKSILKGVYGKIEIEQMQINGIFAPQEAITIKNLYSYIAVIRDNQPIIYKVDCGISQGNLQEIYFENFKEGDKVVVQGQYLLNNNDKVKDI